MVMPRALAEAAAPACSGSHNAVPQARGMTAIAIGSRLQAERVISRTTENVIQAPDVNQLLALFTISNHRLRSMRTDLSRNAPWYTEAPFLDGQTNKWVAQVSLLRPGFLPKTPAIGTHDPLRILFTRA
jgi:hypothetical protein